MAKIYAMGDIHGYYNEMLESLNLVDLKSNKEDKLIFLGDYISRGNNSCAVLYQVKELEETYPFQVKVLIGNHEQMFFDWYLYDDEYEWLLQDEQLMTTKSFFSTEEWEVIYKELLRLKRSPLRMSNYIKAEMKKVHSDLFRWLLLKQQAFYFETDEQIFVHAGISEVDPGLWKYATEEYEFTEKFPAETGYFYKDIIAGHVSSATVAGDDAYLGKVYWDGYSHYYIDGDVVRSKQIPLLKFDSETKLYSSFEKLPDDSWSEYEIR